MKILQILPELNVGGVETGTVDLSKYLIAHGHESVVVSNGGSLVKALEASGTKHYKLPVHKKSLFAVLRCAKALRKIIEEERVDIVHARSRMPAWAAYFATRKTNACFLTTCHGYYSKHFFSRVMGWSKLIIVPSTVIGRHMIDDFGVSPESVRTIPRSVDLDRFCVPKSKKGPTHIVTIIGRLTPLKGHSYFLKAMSKVIRSVPNIKILIVGDAPKKKQSYRHELELLTRRLGLLDNVEFLGNRTDIPQILAKTDVLVLSTVTQEAFGRVILEAQAASVPVVATKVGGVVEIIDDNKTGFLVLPKDTDAMAQSVVKLLLDKDLARRIAEAAKKKLEENFTLEHMAGQTVRVYEELLNMVNILVIKISSIGDVVLITPSLKAIREKYPKANIFCLVGKESRKVLQQCPYIDDLIIIDPKDKEKGFFRMMHFSRKLRRHKFDFIIDFQNNKASHLLSFLSLPKKSFGFKNKKWGFLLTDTVKNPRNDIPPVRHQFQILKLLGIHYHDGVKLELWINDPDKGYVDNLFDSEWLGNTQNIVGINIAASEKWKTKNWPLEYLAELIDMLMSRNIRVVITGLEKDRQAYKHLISLLKTKPASFIGKTDIMQLAALVKKCKVFITPDSAPVHIAAAVGTPFIVFFGPTDSNRHLPPAKRFKVLEKKPDCAPCYSSKCRVMTHVCMKDITPQEVYQNIKELMTVNV